VISRPLPAPAEFEILAETIFGQGVRKLPAGEHFPKAAIGRMMADGSGRRSLAYRHPDPLVEAVRFAICEGEVLQAVGRGRGVRRTADTPLDVLILTDLPLPLPVNVTRNWKDLCDAAGPIEVLTQKGVVPLDYAGIAAALPDWFTGRNAALEWFRSRPSAKAALDAIRDKAKSDNRVDIDEFVGNSNKDLSIGKSYILASFYYRRVGSRQANHILVDATSQRDTRAAIETVLGPIDELKPAKARSFVR